VPADQRDMITDTMKFKYTSNYVLKDNLAMLDILAHNNWKRPICFATTVGNENLIGLQPYLYKEGFVYHLMPLKIDTAVKDPLRKVNTMVMYNTMMNKFKFGKFKTAKFLDHESTTMFYPVMITTFIDLLDDLMEKGRNDLALNLIRKFDQSMPELDVDMRITRSRFSLAQRAFKLNDVAFATKYFNNIDNYIVDQLDYSYVQLQNRSGAYNPYEVQTGIEILYGMADAARTGHQTAAYNKYTAQIKKYESQFASLFKQGE
jgi:hypothetical protein